MKVVWCGPEAKANRGLSRLAEAGLSVTRTDAAPGPDGIAGFEDALSPGDVVVLDGTADAAATARHAVGHGAHVVLPDPADAELVALDDAASHAGVTVLAGLAPLAALAQLPSVLLADAWRHAPAHAPGASMSFLTATGSFPAEPGIFRAGFAAPPHDLVQSLTTPARIRRDFSDLRLDHPADGVSGLDLSLAAPEAMEFCPAHDSFERLSDLGLDPEWLFRDCRRGRLWPRGWAEAWQGVLDALARDRRADHLAAVAEKLALDHPSGDGPDRMVAIASLAAERGGRTIWRREWVMEARGDLRGQAQVRLQSALLALGALSIAHHELPVGVQSGTHDPRTAAAWLAGIDIDLGYRNTILH